MTSGQLAVYNLEIIVATAASSNLISIMNAFKWDDLYNNICLRLNGASTLFNEAISIFIHHCETIKGMSQGLIYRL